MLDLILKSGKKVVIKGGGKYVTFELYTEDNQYMGKITYDSDSLSDMVFCE